MNKVNLSLGVALVAVVIATGAFFVKTQVQFGANPGPLQTNHAEFVGGVTYEKVKATSTDSTTLTLTAGDIAEKSTGAAWDTVIMTPQVGDLALTLPASSTLKYFLPKSGYRARQCWQNASSTSGIDITFAANTGIVLQKATSTSGGIGLPTIGPSSVGCFDFIRATSTASTFDIVAAFTEFKDAD